MPGHDRALTLSLSPLASCCTPYNPQRYCGISAAALEDVHDQIKLLG